MNKTPISILQELMVKEHNVVPRYFECVSDKEGYSFACTVHAGDIKAKGYGGNKKEAKQNSAKEALSCLNFPITDIHKSSCTRNFDTRSCSIIAGNQNLLSMNYVGKLNEFSSANGKPYPQYIDSISPDNGCFLVKCQFINFSSNGYGASKKNAKQDAAMNMLELIKNENIDEHHADGAVISSLRQAKMQNINDLSEDMLKKYAEITINDDGNQRSPSLPSLPCLLNDVHSLDQLQQELEKSGHKVNVTTFQKNPYIIMLQLEGTKCIIMGQGETEMKAHADLLFGARLMLRYGFSFRRNF